MKNLISLVVIVGAIVTASSFKSSPSKSFTNRIFELEVHSAPFTPSSWTEIFISEQQAANDCPGRGNYCHISIPPTDVYSSPQKPKVDIQTATTGELQDDMITSLSLTNEATVLHGRRIFESE